MKKTPKVVHPSRAGAQGIAKFSPLTQPELQGNLHMGSHNGWNVASGWIRVLTQRVAETAFRSGLAALH